VGWVGVRYLRQSFWVERVADGRAGDEIQVCGERHDDRVDPGRASEPGTSRFERGIPVVTIDRRLAAIPVDSIMANDQRAAREAARYLIAQGCRRVGLAAGPVQTTTGASRLAGYRAALRDAGRTLDPSLIAYGDFRTEGGYAATRHLLRQRRPPDGLLISNNLMTVGGLQAIAEAGLGIPRDIAIVGFDDSSWATAPIAHGGRAADLRDRVPGSEAPAPPHRRGEVPTAPRGSTGRAHRAGKLAAHVWAALMHCRPAGKGRDG
jgi:hypothetical protein